MHVFCFPLSTFFHTHTHTQAQTPIWEHTSDVADNKYSRNFRAFLFFDLKMNLFVWPIVPSFYECVFMMLMNHTIRKNIPKQFASNYSSTETKRSTLFYCNRYCCELFQEWMWFLKRRERRLCTDMHFFEFTCHINTHFYYSC